MDATPLQHPCKLSAKSPISSAVLRMKSQLAAVAGQVLQLHPVACEFMPGCGSELMRVPR